MACVTCVFCLQAPSRGTVELNSTAHCTAPAATTPAPITMYRATSADGLTTTFNGNLGGRSGANVLCANTPDSHLTTPTMSRSSGRFLASVAFKAPHACIECTQARTHAHMLKRIRTCTHIHTSMHSCTGPENLRRMPSNYTALNRLAPIQSQSGVPIARDW